MTIVAMAIGGWLIQHFVTTALLIVVVVLACRLVPRRPALQHALWVVVLLKFLMPPWIAWPWSVEQLRSAAWPDMAATSLPSTVDGANLVQDVAIAETPRIDRADPAPFGQPSADVVEVSESDVGRHSHMASSTLSARIDESLLLSAPVESSPAADDRDLLDADAPWSLAGKRLFLLAFAVWLAGALAATLVQLRRIGRHALLVRRGTPAPKYLTEEISRLAGEMRVRTVPALVAPGIPSPFIWCLGRVRMIWPTQLANESRLAGLRGVIAHELAHVRRRDHWVAWLELLAGILWWWNPLFWLARYRLRESAEMACDALAVGAMPTGRRAYAEALLDLSLLSFTTEPAPALGVRSGDRQAFERRLTMILSQGVAGRITMPGVAAAALLALVAMPTWSLVQAAPEENEVEVEVEVSHEAVEPSEESEAAPEQVRESADQPVETRNEVSVDSDDRRAEEPVGGSPTPANHDQTVKMLAELETQQQTMRKLLLKQAIEIDAQRAAMKKQVESLLKQELVQGELRRQLEDFISSLGQTGDDARASQRPPTYGDAKPAMVQVPRRTAADSTNQPATAEENLKSKPGAPDDVLLAPHRATYVPADFDYVTGNPLATPVPDAAVGPQSRPQATSSPTYAPAARHPGGNAEFDADVAADQTDLKSLGIAIIEGRGALKLAMRRSAEVKAVRQNISRQERDAAEVNLETAQQKMELLTELAESALMSLQRERAVQEVLLAGANDLAAKGGVSQSQIAQAKIRLDVTKRKLKLLESILKTKAKPQRE